MMMNNKPRYSVFVSEIGMYLDFEDREQARAFLRHIMRNRKGRGVTRSFNGLRYNRALNTYYIASNAGPVMA